MKNYIKRIPKYSEEKKRSKENISERASLSRWINGCFWCHLSVTTAWGWVKHTFPPCSITVERETLNLERFPSFIQELVTNKMQKRKHKSDRGCACFFHNDYFLENSKWNSPASPPGLIRGREWTAGSPFAVCDHVSGDPCCVWTVSTEPCSTRSGESGVTGKDRDSRHGHPGRAWERACLAVLSLTVGFKRLWVFSTCRCPGPTNTRT